MKSELPTRVLSQVVGDESIRRDRYAAPFVQAPIVTRLYDGLGGCAGGRLTTDYTCWSIRFGETGKHRKGATCVVVDVQETQGSVK